MELTVKKKVFIEELTRVVDDAVKTYGIRLQRIVIEEDEKGCYTVLITYKSKFNL